MVFVRPYRPLRRSIGEAKFVKSWFADSCPCYRSILHLLVGRYHLSVVTVKVHGRRSTGDLQHPRLFANSRLNMVMFTWANQPSLGACTDPLGEDHAPGPMIVPSVGFSGCATAGSMRQNLYVRRVLSGEFVQVGRRAWATSRRQGCASERSEMAKVMPSPSRLVTNEIRIFAYGCVADAWLMRECLI